MPQTFTVNEYEYLEKLRKRNYQLYREWKKKPDKKPISPWEPLEKPMSVKERKVRSSIRRKVMIFAKELTYAFHCGIPPHIRMLRLGIQNVVDMVLLFKGLAWLKDVEEQEDMEEIVATKYRSFSMENGKVVGRILDKEAEGLRERFRTKNPELYIQIEEKVDEAMKNIKPIF